MAEAAVCASGQSYNGMDKDNKYHLFNRFYTVVPLGVEFSIYSSILTECWNHNANMWLKRYVYFRCNRAINRPVAFHVTFLVSALWHGLYPMYFVAFLLYGVATENHDAIYKLSAKYKILRSIPMKCLIL